MNRSNGQVGAMERQAAWTAELTVELTVEWTVVASMGAVAVMVFLSVPRQVSELLALAGRPTATPKAGAPARHERSSA